MQAKSIPAALALVLGQQQQLLQNAAVKLSVHLLDDVQAVRGLPPQAQWHAQAT